MTILSKLRLPYRDDSLFGFLFLATLVIPLAFDVYNFESFEIIKFGLLLVLLGAAGVVFFKRFNRQGISLRLNKKFLLILALFLFWGMLASFAAVDKNYAFLGFYPRFTSGFLFYFLWAALILFLSAQSQKQLGFLIRVLFLCSGLVALWGLLQSIGFGYYNGPTTEFFMRSAPSFLGNPNFAAMFVAALVPVGFSLWQLAKNFSSKVYYALSLFLQVWAIVIFASRGALLALVLGLLACLALSLVFRKSAPKKFSFSLLAALCLVFVMPSGFLNFSRPGTVISSLTLNETNINQRFNVWNLALQSIKARPVLGYGPGSFELVFESHRYLSSVKNGFFDDPHNLFLYLAVSGGAVFLLFFLVIVIYPAWLALKSLFKNKDADAVLTLGLLGGLLAWLAASFFTPVAIPCYVLLAFFISGLFSQSNDFRLPAAKIFRFAGQLTFGILMVFGLCFIAAEHLFFASIRAYNADEFSKAHTLARAAIYLNPANSLYYEYAAGSGIRGRLPEAEINKEISAFSRFHNQRSYSDALLANLNYLRLFASGNPAAKGLILENMDKAIALDPDAANNYFLLSQYQFIFGNLPAAEAAAAKGLKLDPKNFDAGLFLAKVYQYQGNRAMLVKTLEQVASYSESNASLQNLLKLAKTSPDLGNLPFKISLSVGRLD